jgi:hypothetical protein
VSVSVDFPHPKWIYARTCEDVSCWMATLELGAHVGNSFSLPLGCTEAT